MRDFKTEINEMRKIHREKIVSLPLTISVKSIPLSSNEGNLHIPGSFKRMDVKRFAESSIFDQYSQRSPSF